MDVPQVVNDLNAVELKRKRRIWRPFMEKYNIQSFCEIGVFESQNFRRMLESNPKIAVGVDSWIQDGNPAVNDSGFSQERLEQQCELFKSLMVNPSVRLYRQYSHEAVKNFPDEYFDLIYIDADHTKEGCLRDIEDWWPKVKKGRYLTGDDFSHSHAKVTGVVFGVIEAVNEFATKNNLPIYELTSHGWMLIKPL